MSRRTKTIRILFPPKLLATLAIGSLTALGLAFTGPAHSASAEESTPQARVAASIEHGQLQQDVGSGRLTDATATGIAGQHIPASPTDGAIAEQKLFGIHWPEIRIHIHIPLPPVHIHIPHIHVPSINIHIPIHVPLPHIDLPPIHIPPGGHRP
ncbi:hypothetical protein ACMT9U_09725 [Clavibacter sp. Sh2036]|uniref:hypothetical protein n=1 Tax=unclassified Clavibacter TaxID=2626594 RepID=UPI0022EB4DC4|nr:hypothetical protein [Clavibacter sp. CT19]MDA3804813.1 hypothetical protein [Clavibacter sp. CT19]